MSEPQAVRVALGLNGDSITAAADGAETLGRLLRRHGCRSVHLGCEEGVCGACTVLIDGKTARSCLIPAAQADGADVVTVEALASRTDGQRLQDAFVRHHAAQCGYCTPGFLMIGLELLTEYAGRPCPDEAVLRRRLSAAVCRCTGYAPIVTAIRSALEGA